MSLALHLFANFPNFFEDEIFFQSAPKTQKSPIVKNLNAICLCRWPMIENLKFQFPNHVDKISNRFDDNEETFDSSALVSLANGEKRMFCFKNDGITSRLKIKSRIKRYAIEGEQYLNLFSFLPPFSIAANFIHFSTFWPTLSFPDHTWARHRNSPNNSMACFTDFGEWQKKIIF